LLLVAFLLVNAPNCHLSLVLASVVQGDAVNCNRSYPWHLRQNMFVGSVCFLHQAKTLLQISALR